MCRSFMHTEAFTCLEFPYFHIFIFWLHVQSDDYIYCSSREASESNPGQILYLFRRLYIWQLSYMLLLWFLFWYL